MYITLLKIYNLKHVKRKLWKYCFWKWMFISRVCTYITVKKTRRYHLSVMVSFLPLNIYNINLCLLCVMCLGKFGGTYFENYTRLHPDIHIYIDFIIHHNIKSWLTSRVFHYTMYVLHWHENHGVYSSVNPFNTEQSIW